MNRRSALYLTLALVAAGGAAWVLRGAAADPNRTAAAPAAGTPAGRPAEPKIVAVEGRLTSINDAFAKFYKADTTTRSKEPTYGIKAADGWYVILHTRDSERFWLDPRMRDRDLILNGRLFPDSRVIEVLTVQCRREGKVFDVFYWCELCAIKAVTDDACVCCQGDVELRERPAAK